MKKKFSRAWLLVLVIALVFSLTACGGGGDTEGEAPVGDSNEPVYGGVLRAVLESEPSSLDLHMEDADTAYEVGWHIFETILTLDEKDQVIPMLADYEMSEDGKTITLNLRENVPFHNGDIMDADDVVTSLTRWHANAPLAKKSLGDPLNIRKEGDDTVIIELAQPSSTALLALAHPDQGPYIMPKEVCDAAGLGKVTEYIGTGPYKFVEFLPDRHIKVVKFEDYAAIDLETTGIGGKKMAYLDEIYFLPVSEGPTVQAGMKAGDFDCGIIATEVAESMDAEANLYAMPLNAGEMPGVVFNKQEGVFTDYRMRLALLKCMNMEDILLAAFGDPQYYDIHPNHMPAYTYWMNEEGADLYNHLDIEGAQALMKEAGYNGEEIVFLSTTTYDYMYKSAMVLTSQLKEAGWNVNMKVVDWATLAEYRYDPTAYDIVSSGFTAKPDPTMIVWLDEEFAGWYVSEKKDALMEQLVAEFDQEKRVEIWKELSALIYEELPVVKFGEIKYGFAANNKVKNVPNYSHLYYWNAWVTE